MANETVSSSINWTALATTKAFNETITINSGATLTLDQTVDAQGTADALAGVKILATSGESTFEIVNTSTTTPILYAGPRSGDLRVENDCTWRVRGGFIILQDTGTDWKSDGTASQVVSGSVWTALYDKTCEPAVIFVETGDGTNVWEPWMNVANLSLSDIGQGGTDGVGKWFKYDPDDGSIAFGDDGAALAGTGGDIPPEHARIRVYNIGITTRATSGGAFEINATDATNFDLDVSPAGNADIENCYLFGFYFNATSFNSCVINSVGAVVKPAFSTCIFSLNVTGLRVCPNRYSYTNSFAFTTLYDAVFEDCFFCAERTSQSYQPLFRMSTSGVVLFDNSVFELIKRSTFTTVVFDVVSPSYGVEFKDCKFIGGKVTTVKVEEDVKITNCKHSDSPNSVSYGVNIEATSGPFVIDGFTNLSNCSIFSSNTTPVFIEPKVLKNVNYEHASNTSVRFKDGGVTIHDCYLGSPISTLFTFDTFYNNAKIQNVRTGNYPALNYGRMGYGPYKAVYALEDAADASNKDSHFYERQTSAGVGSIGLLFTPKSDTSTAYETSGTVYFDGAGKLYLRSAGASITYTWPWKIIGWTSIPAGGGITVGGTGTGNFTIEASLDGGTTWDNLDSAWATFSARTITATGQNLKIRISHSAGSLTDNLRSFYFDTDVDYDTYKYPYEYVSITLQHVADGSRYYIEDSSGDEVATGVQSGTGDIVIENIPYTADELLLIRVRKATDSPKYKPYSTNATLTSNGASVYVSQVLDE